MTARTSGLISRGMSSTGSRTSIRVGLICSARRETQEQGLNGTAKDQDVGREHDEQDRNGDPTDVLVEIRDDVIELDTAVTEVLADLDPYGVAVRLLLHARPEDRPVAAQRFQEGEIGRAIVVRKNRCPVLARREQYAALLVEHRIGVAAIGFRELAAQAGRKLERPAAVRARHEMTGEQFGLLAHRPALEIFDVGIQGPIKRERHEDRRDDHSYAVQQHDARQDRLEPRHPTCPPT